MGCDGREGGIGTFARWEGLVSVECGRSDGRGVYLFELFSGLLSRPGEGGFSGGLEGMEGVDVHLEAFGYLWNFGQTFEELVGILRADPN